MKHATESKPPMSRRAVLRAMVAGATAPWVARGRVRGANGTIGVGFIGAGSRASAHMGMVRHLNEQGEAVELVAVCDVYRPRREEMARKFGIPRVYPTHHELLQDPDVDVVCIATPDHHHGYQALDAMAAGKGMYIEKPLTHWRQIELTLRLVEAAQRTQCIATVGCQAMSDPAWRQMKALVQEGRIGRPLFGETGYFRVGDWGERGMPVPDPNVRPGSDLDWEAFLGDAPKREFNVDRFFRWRLFEEYAGGPVTDLFPHSLTPLVDILGAAWPHAVTGMGAIHVYPYELREVPDTFNLIAHYPENMTIVVLGSQGNDHPTTVQRGAGMRSPVVRGTEGTLTIAPSNRAIQFMPVRAPGVSRKPDEIPIQGHEDNVEMWRDLFRCVREQCPATMCPIELAARAQLVLQLAMWSHQRGRVARYDASTRRWEV